MDGGGPSYRNHKRYNPLNEIYVLFLDKNLKEKIKETKERIIK